MFVELTKYTLMHKNIPTIDMFINDKSGYIEIVGTLVSAEHLPIGISCKNDIVNEEELNEWWSERCIPANREGFKQLFYSMNMNVRRNILTRCMGLSLSDQYWICPTSSGVRWEEVNFFQNAFSDDVGNILLGRGSSTGRVSLMSPDNTSDGWLKKKWAILDERRCLMKGGSGATQQEPYNEVLASSVMERLGIPHVTYTLTVQEDYPYSVCEDFITPETELIPAWYIMQTVKRPNHVSVYQHYMDCCEALGIPGVREAVDRMIVLDYLIVNEDRHQNNFGVVRNAETLEYLGAAPIYDSGTSLWFDKPTGMVGSGRVTCKPFKDRHEEQIKLVSSFDWLDLSRLDSIEEEWMELTKGSLFLDEARRIAVARALRWRIETLKEISRCGVYAVPGTGHDVTEDIRYSGQSEQ